LSIESVLILGIGNTLLTDEGIGVHLVQRIRPRLEAYPAIEILDGGTLSFTLAEPIARADGLIVVDAARMQSPPGTVRVYCDAEMDEYLHGNRQSVHEVSLSDLLDIARLSEQLPQHRCLVGIEPQCLDWGDSPSAALQTAMHTATQRIMQLLSAWGVLIEGR
jgi:hydrogenase maturation protease